MEQSPHPPCSSGSSFVFIPSPEPYISFPVSSQISPVDISTSEMASPGQGYPFHDRFKGKESYGTATVSDTLSTFLVSSSLAPTPQRATQEEQPKSSYFKFFLSELWKCFPYVNLFPWTAANLFSSSNHNPALRESVLAVAALIANRGSEGEREALEHLQKALQMLREGFSNLEADEGMAISSFLLAHLSLMMGDFVTAKKHLQGMSAILNNLDRGGPGLYEEPVPSPLNTEKLTLLIWRMAIRVDFISSIACGKAPVLPRFEGFFLSKCNYSVPEEEERIYRQWIQSNADTEVSPDNADWADAWFSLDALMHRFLSWTS